MCHKGLVILVIVTVAQTVSFCSDVDRGNTSQLSFFRNEDLFCTYFVVPLSHATGFPITLVEERNIILLELCDHQTNLNIK